MLSTVSVMYDRGISFSPLSSLLASDDSEEEVAAVMVLIVLMVLPIWMHFSPHFTSHRYDNVVSEKIKLLLF